MKRNSFLLVVTATAVGLTAVSAMASPRGVDFSTLDLDGDGALTLEEVQASARVRFDAADSDGNGLLSAAELEAHAQARAKDRAARMIERMDANADGQLSPDELTPRRDPARMFDRIDADNSGTITQAEFDAARERVRGRFGKRRHGDQ
ncbi:MAG: EF-hand domain-containing protein [Pseudomonadota bacterium]